MDSAELRTFRNHCPEHFNEIGGGVQCKIDIRRLEKIHIQLKK